MAPQEPRDPSSGVGPVLDSVPGRMEVRRRPAPMLDERTLRPVVAAVAAVHIGLGGWQLLAPGSFFEHVGRYGAENTHYVGDIGAFTLAFGIAALLAVTRPSWRAPVFAVGALWYALHALNHLFDIDENRISEARGVLDTVLIALGAALLAWLARASAVTSAARRVSGE
jgi:hypothetical protein